MSQDDREQNATRRDADYRSDNEAALTARVGEAQKAAVTEEACRSGVKAPGASQDEPDGMIAYSLAIQNPSRDDPNWPLPSFDAKDWAEAFCKLISDGRAIDE